MSTNKTPFLNLNSWVGTDPIVRDEFNNNFQLLDDKLKVHDDIMNKNTNDISTNNNSLVSQLADNAISPDSYTGTDFQRLQSAINDALTNKKGIRLNRMFDVTGGGSLLINKVTDDRIPLRFIGLGGGIKKTDAGFLFSSTSAFVGDIHFNNVKFESSPGAGTQIFNASKIIRVFSMGCTYLNCDSVIYTATDFIQSYHFTGGSIVGGSGTTIVTPGAFDLIFSGVLVEAGNNFFQQLKGTASAYPSLYNANFNDVCIEGLTGKAYQITATTVLKIDGGYMEGNAGDIVFDSTGVYVGVSISNIRSQITTNFDSRAVIVWGGQVQTAKVFNVTGVGLPVSDTTNITSGKVASENDRKQGGSATILNIDPSNRLLRSSNTTDYTTTSGVSISTFGTLRRLSVQTTRSLTASTKQSFSMQFNEALYTDDLLTLQMHTDFNVQLLGFYASGTTVIVWVNNLETSAQSVTFTCNILKPHFSVLG